MHIPKFRVETFQKIIFDKLLKKKLKKYLEFNWKTLKNKKSFSIINVLKRTWEETRDYGKKVWEVTDHI
jgi:hypothetical protein